MLRFKTVHCFIKIPEKTPDNSYITTKTCVELIQRHNTLRTGGYFSNSLAIINEALHQLFDLSSLLMSLVAAWIARWRPNEKKTFGYFRAGKKLPLLSSQLPSL